MKNFKKNVLLVLFLLLFLFGCNSKNKSIIGEQEDIILNKNELNTLSKKENVILSSPRTFKNYYGDNSILNDNIENYLISGNSDNLKFRTLKISRKNFFVNSYYFSNPVIIDNILYILDTKGNLIAKNLNSKKNIWKLKVIEKDNFVNYYGGKISYYDKTIFLATRLNEVLAISTDGKIIWRKQINSIPISTPIIDNNNLYVITSDNKLYAFDKKDGRIKWINYGNIKDSAIFGSADPVIYKNYIIASYSSGELFILDKNTGNSLFNTDLTGKYFTYSSFELTDIDSTPVIKNDILIATANDGITVGIDLKKLTILWKQNLASLSNILVNGDHLFLMTTDNSLICINIKSGGINWTKKLENYKNMKKKKEYIYYKTLAFVNNDLIAFDNIGKYKIFNPTNGELKNTKKIKYSLLGNIFSLNNKIYATVENGSSIELIIEK